MITKIRKCVVIVSHPRSGTHLTIDFIRKNFPSFNPSRNVWDSSKRTHLLVNGAASIPRIVSSPPVSDDRSLIVKTHAIDPDAIATCLRSRFAIDNLIFVYPFRKFSNTIRSFAEFVGFRGTIRDFLATHDTHFGMAPSTVGDCARLHGRNWLSMNGAFLDTEAIVNSPDLSCEALSNLLDAPAADLKVRLPRRRRFGGRYGELLERLSGMESTDVRIRCRKSWENDAEREYVDHCFEDLFAEMMAKKIN